MKSKTIVLWGREDLLCSSIKFFLTHQKGWRVVNISDEENLDVLMQAIQPIYEEHPDVVIIQQKERADNLNLPMKLLKTYPELKIITVNPNDNLMEVYSKQNILLNSVSDLVSVVEATPNYANQLN